VKQISVNINLDSSALLMAYAHSDVLVFSLAVVCLETKGGAMMWFLGANYEHNF
jgi:hypothetical protein